MDERNDEQADNDSDAKRPLSFRELLTIILSGHLGVRKREQRVNDFGRANGLHVFAAAILYFALVVTGLIILVSYIAK
ncbi:MAG: DUF2970 domain-containing protein [Halioglobus sp.]